MIMDDEEHKEWQKRLKYYPAVAYASFFIMMGLAIYFKITILFFLSLIPVFIIVYYSHKDTKREITRQMQFSKMRVKK